MRKLDPEKHEKKRQEILGAAMRCFLRSGLKGASTAEICAEAGISPGHLYHYFESKDAIIAALAEGRLEKISERLKDIVSGGRSVVAALLSELGGQPGGPAGFALFFEILAESRRNPEVGKIVHGHNRSMRGLLAEVLRYGQSRGEIQSQLDPEVAGAAIIGLTHAVKAVALQDPKQDASKVTALLQQLLVRLLTTSLEDARKEPGRTKKALARSRA
ncbi:TetR/AcrR family transcriptional regulator [Bradyrhizobium paxllaeri]|uniref:TetR/AcrR family transcriptional regulator n=1 Tax=Bradyrhizobium paxllaeri TaxID=190148 RepID=UPI00081074BA|nr:TetR/AcrR family transcriptional regulator [Bradyrhizobium paxllaeri]